MIIQRLFSKSNLVKLSIIKNDPKYKNSLIGIDKLEKNRTKIKELGLKLTSTLLMAYMNHPLTVVTDDFAYHIIKEGWFRENYYPLVNGLDMQDLLVLDLDSGNLFEFDVEKPRKLTPVDSIGSYVNIILKELEWRAKDTGYEREIKPFIKKYKKLCL